MVSKLLEKGITTDAKATDDGCASGDDSEAIVEMKRKAVVLEDDMSPGGKPMSRKYSQMKTLKLLCNQDKQIQRVLPLDDSMSVAAQQEA
jgi:hypothetical protein